MKVLVTGGLGFIGKNLIKKYQSEYEFIVFSRERNISKNSKESIHLEYGDVSGKKIIKIIEKLKPETVIHLAALSGLKKCEENPEKAFQINVTGTANVVEGCLAANARLIFISTREVYGFTDKKSNEDDRLNPINTYGQTKMNAEKIIESAKDSGLNYTILRLSNVYGPGGNEGLNKIIENAVIRKKIVLNGGNQIINPVYVNDVVDFIHTIIFANIFDGIILNIGSKESLSLKQFIEKVSNFVKNVNIVSKTKPKYETNFFKPNLNRAFKNGYVPKIKLEQGIKNTVDFFEKK